MKPNKWVVTDVGLDMYLGQRIVNEEVESVEVRAHCLACAKVEILSRHGGYIDTRGWHKQGTCGAFMASFPQGDNQDANNERDSR